MVTAWCCGNPKQHVMQFLLWTGHSSVLCSEPVNWPLTSLLKLSSNWSPMFLHIVRLGWWRCTLNSRVTFYLLNPTSVVSCSQGVVVTKMERLMTSQRAVQDLEEFQFGPEGRKFPLFHSWNTKLFGEFTCSVQCTWWINLSRVMMFLLVSEESSRALLESFCQELKLKQLILQELAHTVTSDLCMVYLSCWLHQPFIPPQTRLMLEALLLETGHRPLWHRPSSRVVWSTPGSSLTDQALTWLSSKTESMGKLLA